MSQVMVYARFPADLVQSLRASAEDSDRTLSAELRHAVRKHLSTSNAPAANRGAAKADDGGRHERE